jgi:hypothetical protein
LLRAAAGLTGVYDLYDLVSSGDRTPPTQLLEQLDSHYLLIWQAHRALLDLWNDAESDQDPYYLRVFDAYCYAAKAAYTRYDDHPNTYDGVDLDLERDKCISQFDTDKLVTPRISGDDLREDGESIEVDVTVTPDKNSPMCEPYIEVYTTNSGGGNSILRISATALGDANARRVGIPIGPENRELPIKLRLEKTQIGKQGTLHATGFFRGRKELSPISVLTSGEEYVFPKQSFPQPTVRVSGSPAKKVAIMFVMDCSYSMTKSIKDEGTRLHVATEALKSILGTLLENRDAENDCRIGVLAFSHRVGYEGDNGPEIKYSKSYDKWLMANPTATKKTPDDDLETVFGFSDPNNRLSKDLNSRIAKKCKDWEPLGNTPLYYSMSQALAEFQAVRDAESKHLIVITDGNDELLGGRPQWLEDFTRRTGRRNYGAEEIGKLLRDNFPDVDVTVLGIAMPSFSGRDPINTLAPRNIQFYTVSRQEELIASIEKALGLGRYTVHDVEKRSQAAEQKIPGICQLKQWNIPAVYEVSMPAWTPVPKPARLFIEGGEAFELVLDAEQGGIVHRRYDPREFLPTTADTADAFVSVLYPTRESDRVTFSVTLQNMNEKEFSPRPVGIWATITPVRTEGGDDVGPSYHFFDRQFEARTPVPVLDFTIYAWPAEANWARLELWYRVAKELDPAFEDIKANAEKDLVTPADLKEFQVDGITGITFSVRRAPMETGNGTRVIVDERYDNGGKDIHQTRIMATPPANNIIRSYNREGGFARHVFEYYGANNQNQPGKLLITSRERIQQAYSPLKKPLLVKLPLKQ